MTEFEVRCVFSHPDFYLVDKPAGIGFHDDEIQGQRRLGVFNLCAQALGETLFPVHRLDKLTSGLMLLARNKEAAAWFQRAFELRHIEKLYLALSDRKPKKKQGSVIGDMEKARASAWKLTKSKTSPALTKFFSWGLDTELKGLGIFLVKPETGKTHQIRVALKSLGSPILGDALYGGGEADRGYLHAYGLRFHYRDETFCFYCYPDLGHWFKMAEQQIKGNTQDGFDLPWPNQSRKLQEY